MTAFVQHLGDATVAVFGNSLALSISKTVTVGNTIFVGGGGAAGARTAPSAITDNLGNTYSLVERDTSGFSGAGLMAAPVTNGGTLTTITVTFTGNSDNRSITAAEFSGVGVLSVAGGATHGASTSASWVVSKTIPANGLAIGVVTSFDVNTFTAGSASGSPSTSITKDTSQTGPPTIALAYAIAGGSDVTSFTGTLALSPTDDWGAAGGVYGVPVSVAPTAGSLVLAGTTPTIAATLLPTAGALVLTGSAPTVSTPVVVAPTAASLVLSGATPIVSTPVSVAPTAGALVLTGATPIVSTPVHVAPTSAALVLTGIVPIVTVGDAVHVNPGPAHLVLTGAVPIVTVSGPTTRPRGGRRHIGPINQLPQPLPIRLPMPRRVRPTPAHLFLAGAIPAVTIIDDADVMAILATIA